MVILLTSCSIGITINHHRVKVFGCDCYAYITKDNRGKVDPNYTTALVFVGIDCQRNCYIGYDVLTHQVINTNSMVFHETSFTQAHLTQTSPHIRNNLSSTLIYVDCYDSSYTEGLPLNPITLQRASPEFGTTPVVFAGGFTGSLTPPFNVPGPHLPPSHPIQPKSGRLFIPSDITRRNQQYASGVAPSLYPPYPPTPSTGAVYPPVVLPQQFSDHHPILNRGVGTTSHTGTVSVSPPTHSPLHASGVSSRSTPLVRNSFVTPGGSEDQHVNTNASYPVNSYPTSSLSSLSAPASNNYQSSLPLRSPDSYVSSYLPPPLVRTRNTMQPTLTQLTGAGNGTTTDSNVTGATNSHTHSIDLTGGMESDNEMELDSTHSDNESHVTTSSDTISTDTGANVDSTDSSDTKTTGDGTTPSPH